MIQSLEKAIHQLLQLSESEQREIAQRIIITRENKKIADKNNDVNGSFSANELDKKIIAQKNAWDILEDMAGTIEAPQDWSQNHDYYLYGLPKQSQENE
ncbi:MAG: hypothetical protein DSM107014_02620 [Gomphosphaeria aponina SAG 52.96 = DSM 107014]|uniref:Uncharacterized protein n=1 Tax=Gomphosphaeria aponina SAG 52.96 = DSM 107014 TaxID=1521640 RepID=A0A941GN30_9CHRO|nr:hypothetical protein [Gomphosphaeria aponina SAG 52.96 = DSM 107014]